MKTSVQFNKYLSDKGLRSTRQRESIAAGFFSVKGHVTAEELYHRVSQDHPDVGLATVYRTLRLLCQAGLAKEHRFGESSMYEPVTPEQHHDHLICVNCGRVQEFENPRIEKLQDEVAARHRFKVKSHKLELYGLCSKCEP